MQLSEPTRTFALTHAEELYLSSVMCGKAPKLQHFSIYFQNFPGEGGGGWHAPRPTYFHHASHAGSTSPPKRLLLQVSPLSKNPG